MLLDQPGNNYFPPMFSVYGSEIIQHSFLFYEIFQLNDAIYVQLNGLGRKIGIGVHAVRACGITEVECSGLGRNLKFSIFHNPKTSNSKNELSRRKFKGFLSY